MAGVHFQTLITALLRLMDLRPCLRGGLGVLLKSSQRFGFHEIPERLP